MAAIDNTTDGAAPRYHCVRTALTLLLLIGGLVSPVPGQASPPPPSPRLPLELLPDTLAICRLSPDAALPAWASLTGRFVTLSRTAEELSVTAVQDAIPASVRCERDYRALRVKGTLPPNLVGILLSIARPLAERGLAIFAISTFDTDYVLVKARDLSAALDALRAAGHTIHP
ncbi:MAG: ACT domain-containing protein [Gemmatimonadales bacterium]|nr:ACT domain-containing protein [Gemmatimonadales bacterium]